MSTTSENKTIGNVETGQEEEITSLREYFKDKIRILSSIGQFSYILKIRADQYDVSLTLQLDKSYPLKTPEIIITAPRLTPDQIFLVQQLLQSYSEILRNKPMVLSIYSRLLQWFDENHIQTLSSNNPSTPTIIQPPRSPTNDNKTTIPFGSVNNNHTNNRKVSQSVDEQPDGEQSKKPSMKTADDVISRIEWDDRLDRNSFRVGYFDRFLGLQEKSFGDFDFKIDLSTVSDRHTNILAIPKHRIQYFKYGNEIIWDKETRTDFMFGSTGNPITIDDLIKKNQNSIDNDNKTKDDQSTSQIETDDSIPPPRYLTSTDGHIKPNYYLSIPITDPTLITRSTAYRQHLLDSIPFSSSLVTFAPKHFHLTLVTLRLDTSAQIERHIIALKRIQEELRYHCSYPDQLRLDMIGFDIFNGKTLFLKCQTNLRLNRLRTLIIERLSEQYKDEQHTLFAGNYYEFIPHLTLLKSKRKIFSLPQNLNDEQQQLFGSQTVDTLQLCPIGGTMTCSNSMGEQEESNRCVFQLDLS